MAKIKAKTKTKIKPKTKTKTNPKAVAAADTYILLDRSASMSDRWLEALASINTYVAKLAENKAKCAIALATFDIGHTGVQFDIIRKVSGYNDWRDLFATEVFPRGATPLYDAIGKIVALAEADAPKHAVIAVMTDGEENSSTEVSKAQAKAILDRCRAKGWTVLFLGADFEAFGQSASVGVSHGSTITMLKGSYGQTMSAFAANNMNTMSGARATMDWSDEDRNTARGIANDNKKTSNAA